MYFDEVDGYSFFVRVSREGDTSGLTERGRRGRKGSLDHQTLTRQPRRERERDTSDLEVDGSKEAKEKGRRDSIGKRKGTYERERGWIRNVPRPRRNP